jgi:hypothetical protein
MISISRSIWRRDDGAGQGFEVLPQALAVERTFDDRRDHPRSNAGVAAGKGRHARHGQALRDGLFLPRPSRLCAEHNRRGCGP